MRSSSAAAALLALALALPARAEEAGAAPAPAEEAKGASEAGQPAALGLALDLGVSSAYVFRGYNMFQKSSQWDPHAFLAPAVTWTVGETGLSLGYWGAYQFLGGNVGAAIDAGVGAENDLVVTFGRKLVGELTAGAAFTAYLYPGASKAVAGTSFPVYLEPALFAAWATAVDVGLRASYYHGVQGAIGAYRYVYLNPTVGKTIAFSDRVSLLLNGSFGAKLFTDTSTAVSQSNRFDVLASAAVSITVVGPLYVKPGVSWAWTDLAGKSVGDEMVVFGGVNVGAAL